MSKRKSETPLLDAKVRFWSKVTTAAPNECWMYKGDKDGFGYGRVTVAGRKFRTHRFSYTIHHNLTMDDIEGVVIRHTCDNPSCVNPNHLIPGTPRDNIHDAIERGRNAKGDKSPKSKLTAAAVVMIRSLHKTHGLNQAQLADAFGVHPATVNDLLLYKTWKHL